MTHLELASKICAVIAEERYDDALDLLPAYAQAVTEECLSDNDFRRARDFLRAACKSVKLRRAHYVLQLRDLVGNRAYCNPNWPSPSLDVTG
jgi:hypothetical protein